MSDLCFICRLSGTYRPCKQCSLTSHYNCWNTYCRLHENITTAQRYSLQNDTLTVTSTVYQNEHILCPVCNYPIPFRTPITRSRTEPIRRQNVIFTFIFLFNILRTSDTSEQLKYRKKDIIDFSKKYKTFLVKSDDIRVYLFNIRQTESSQFRKFARKIYRLVYT